MKEMIKVFSVFVSMIMVVSCATTPGPPPEKYNLDNELEEVKQIYTLTVSSWEEVDIQSVILRAHLSDYYLLVLDRPMESRITDLTIGVSSRVSSITPGFDKIYVEHPWGRQYYVIEKIYKLKGKEQAKEIKERLRKNSE
jgi:hypothetical protein